MSTEAWEMSAEGRYVLDAALRLPQRDREILADRLNASIDLSEVDAEWEEVWSNELDRREAELDSGAVQPLTLDDIHRIVQEARHGKASN